MLKVGLTGGIGSGKSTVAKLFDILGVPVYDADARARYLMTHDEKLKTSLMKAFGPDSFLPGGQLNRKAIAALVFSNKEALAILNGLVHPRVRIDFENWSKYFHHLPYVIDEAALLFESGASKFLDQIILVSADKKLRIERVIKRDKMNRNEVIHRINNQADQQKLLAASDFFISNNAEDLLIPQVLAIHAKLIER